MTMRDLLDDTMASWRRERPDLDLEVMATALRLSQLAGAAARAVDAAVGTHGITLGEFDVLAALRRGGPRTVLTPTVLARVAMVSPAGMTNRLNRLEEAGLIVRTPDPTDRRGSLVELTRRGSDTADRAVEALLEVEHAVFSEIGETERRRLDRTLDRLIAALEPSA